MVLHQRVVLDAGQDPPLHKEVARLLSELESLPKRQTLGAGLETVLRDLEPRR